MGVDRVLAGVVGAGVRIRSHVVEREVEASRATDADEVAAGVVAEAEMAGAEGLGGLEVGQVEVAGEEAAGGQPGGDPGEQPELVAAK